MIEIKHLQNPENKKAGIGVSVLLAHLIYFCAVVPVEEFGVVGGGVTGEEDWGFSRLIVMIFGYNY